MGFGISPLELLIMGLVCLAPLVIAGAVGGVIVSRKRTSSGMLPCKMCRRMLSPQAQVCRHCGQPSPVG